MKTIVITILAASIGVTAPATAQVARERDRGGSGGDRICFYRDVQFQGREWCYQPGDELADLRDARNEISSIRVFGRARVVVYDGRVFEGISDEFDMDAPDLRLRNMQGTQTWNDRIESFQVESAFAGGGRGPGGRNARGGRPVARERDRLCVFDGVNYSGRSQCWDAGMEEPNLNRTNGWNDRIKSIRLFGRASAYAYRDADYRGERLRLDRDVADLGALRWSDQISSFQVR